MGAFVLAALACLGTWLFSQGLMGRAGADRHVLVISVDGMGADFYRQTAPKARVPNLARLRAEGSSAEAVEGVYPSVTYPSHTTIVTGRSPAEHGIYSNVSVREPGKKTGGMVLVRQGHQGAGPVGRSTPSAPDLGGGFVAGHGGCGDRLERSGNLGSGQGRRIGYAISGATLHAGAQSRRPRRRSDRCPRERITMPFAHTSQPTC